MMSYPLKLQRASKSDIGKGGPCLRLTGHTVLDRP